LELDAKKITLPPNQTARSDGMKIIEGQFECERQDLQALHPDASARICDIANATGKHASSFVKKQ